MQRFAGRRMRVGVDGLFGGVLFLRCRDVGRFRSACAAGQGMHFSHEVWPVAERVTRLE